MTNMVQAPLDFGGYKHNFLYRFFQGQNKLEIRLKKEEYHGCSLKRFFPDRRPLKFRALSLPWQYPPTFTIPNNSGSRVLRPDDSISKNLLTVWFVIEMYINHSLVMWYCICGQQPLHCGPCSLLYWRVVQSSTGAQLKFTTKGSVLWLLRFIEVGWGGARDESFWIHVDV